MAHFKQLQRRFNHLSAFWTLCMAILYSLFSSVPLPMYDRAVGSLLSSNPRYKATNSASEKPKIETRIFPPSDSELHAALKNGDDAAQSSTPSKSKQASRLTCYSKTMQGASGHSVPVVFWAIKAG